MSRVGLVATDLDGTLLDRDDLRLRPGPTGPRRAAGAAACRSSWCSSKTRAEMEPLAAAIGADGPLVVENGGAIVVPPGRRAVAPWWARRDGARLSWCWA